MGIDEGDECAQEEGEEAFMIQSVFGVIRALRDVLEEFFLIITKMQA